jgi:hypothetical protein
MSLTLNRADIKEKIDHLGRDIESYQKILNDEAIWLIVFVVGCWGVNLGLARLGVTLMGATLACFRFFKRIPSKQLFAARKKELEKCIDKLSPGHESSQLYEQLEDVFAKQSSIRHIFATIPYLICWLFLLFTLATNYGRSLHPIWSEWSVPCKALGFQQPEDVYLGWPASFFPDSYVKNFKK